MDSQTMWLVIAAVVIALAIGAWVYAQRQRRIRLRTQFGPEYDRTVKEVGSPAQAESILAERAKRVRELKIRRLSHDRAEMFSHEWKRIQTMLVDDPDGAAAAEPR